MWKKDFTLVQQTPMWHFQYEEKDATLRATELKPKLDRFLIAWWRRETGAELTAKTEWLIDKEHPAFDYKIQIQAGKSDPKDYSAGLENNHLYFGNTGIEDGDAGKKELVMAQDGIHMRITCFHPELLDLIMQCVPTFFLLTNFGTRQDKGFGSFVVKGEEDKSADLLTKWYGDKPVYMLDYAKKQVVDKPEDVLNDIQTIYAALKSGINESYFARWNPNYAYLKAYLTRYFLRKGIGGEKRFMKVHHIAPARTNPNRPVTEDEWDREEQRLQDKDFRYIRGLLGTTDVQAWGRDSIKISSTNRDIKRIPSPIVFKPAGNKLFILINDIPEEIYGAEFEFQGRGHGRLRIPQRSEFDLQEMFRGFVEDINGRETRTALGRMSQNSKPYFVIHNLTVLKCEGGRN